MAIDDLIQDATRRMQKSVEAAQAEFATLRTGRASTALSLCMDNALPIYVFGLDDERNIARVALGEEVGTVISTPRRDA